MKAAAFEYHAPDTVDEVVRLLSDLGDDAKVIAGGQSLVPMLAFRLAVVEHLVDLRKLTALRGVREVGDSVWVGAGTTQATILRSSGLASAVPLLTRATPLIGHHAIRNRGTLGGSLAHADAAAEYPAVAVALGAFIETTRRVVPATDFFTGLWTTALEPDELITGVTFPRRGPRSGFAIEEFARRAGDFALAGAAVAIELDEDGRIAGGGIGLFGLAPVPQRVPLAIGDDPAGLDASAIGRAAVDQLPSIRADQHGSSGYRRRVGVEMVVRAWTRALREATAHD
ncbi:FAD binding domain-containing protein [Cryptosporangium phraense]|uniref:Xanthine dehydrogenase family protein subunit M n=1 Tax=Cryptosporangium phraense TaxID=2593070 RepID=A0A545APS8_9ACTN|nr:FAD binding domain-containing protein [Cryptosporangium phraense]TQS43329.1 xanthine dehydrogenase family protein subunit M [Cryptosporangium phraense]